MGILIRTLHISVIYYPMLFYLHYTIYTTLIIASTAILITVFAAWRHLFSQLFVVIRSEPHYHTVVVTITLTPVC